MYRKKTLTLLVYLIVLISAVTTLTGILSGRGPGAYEYRSIRDKSVIIYGKGLYRHMSADVAVQGIAQDYVTLFAGIPLLLISLYYSNRGSVKGRFILTGTSGYFFVTYLFYTAMGMYNIMFTGYAALLGLSFFTLTIMLSFSFDNSKINSYFKKNTPVKFAGGFLIFNTIAIALLWLSIIVPPLIDGTIYPAALDHYTTLIVQGFDLGLLLPIGFVSGLMLIKKKPLGYLFGTSYLVFLSILMTALTAKIIGMSMTGVNVFPAVLIIPLFTVLSILSASLLLRNIIEEKE